MDERTLIEYLAKDLPRAPQQKNNLFESDAEILDMEGFAGGKLLFSTDEFSKEDYFLQDDGYKLGRNICIATLSDIVASGGTPLYYAHSLSITPDFTESFLRAFYSGIGDVLKEAGAYFIGGDFGRGTEWRCCASAIGTAERPILRSGAKEGDYIYLTGPCGTGNLAAAAGIYKIPLSKHLVPGFALRTKALADLSAHATAAIDTSDGVFNAVSTIADMSKAGFSLENIPYIKAGVVAAKLMKLPIEMLMFCECGEYEILFTSPQELPYHKIGKITAEGRTLNGQDVSHISVSARAYPSLKEYLKEVKRICAGL